MVLISCWLCVEFKNIEYASKIHSRAPFGYGKEDCFLENLHLRVFGKIDHQKLKKSKRHTEHEKLTEYESINVGSHCTSRIHAIGKCNENFVVILDHRAFELSLREGKIFMIKSMNFRAINRIVHYGKDLGNGQALIDLNDEDPIIESFTWKAVVKDGCYGIFRPNTPAPTTTTATSFMKIKG